jgi:hypothetical protein
MILAIIGRHVTFPSVEARSFVFQGVPRQCNVEAWELTDGWAPAQASRWRNAEATVMAEELDEKRAIPREVRLH